jgi:hypothetical protein
VEHWGLDEPHLKHWGMEPLSPPGPPCTLCSRTYCTNSPLSSSKHAIKWSMTFTSTFPRAAPPLTATAHPKSSFSPRGPGAGPGDGDD